MARSTKNNSHCFRRGAIRVETEATAVAGYAISEDGAYASTTLITVSAQPFDWMLHPTAYLEGQLEDTPGKGVAGAMNRALPIVVNENEMASGRPKFSQRMEVPAIETTTDADGKYRLGPLPRLTPIRWKPK